MSEITSTHGNTVVTEAPASWNTKYITPDGFVCQLTLRADNGKDLIDKATAALAWLREKGFLPCENTYKPRFDGKKTENKQPVSAENTQPASESASNQAAHLCPVHNCEMKRWEKNGRIWFSHKTDNGWCTGKSK